MKYVGWVCWILIDCVGVYLHAGNKVQRRCTLPFPSPQTMRDQLIKLLTSGVGSLVIALGRIRVAKRVSGRSELQTLR